MEITGPGLAQAITLPAPGSPTVGPDFSAYVTDSGYFAQVFGARDGLSSQPPSGDLGPRYSVSFTMSLPGRAPSVIEQDLYPYAAPGPVTYLAPGQTFWGHSHTHGGWYLARAIFQKTLTSIGLPAGAPAQSTAARSADTSKAFPVAGLIAVALLALVVLVGVVIKRRRGAAGPRWS